MPTKLGGATHGDEPVPVNNSHWSLPAPAVKPLFFLYFFFSFSYFFFHFFSLHNRTPPIDGSRGLEFRGHSRAAGGGGRGGEGGSGSRQWVVSTCAKIHPYSAAKLWLEFCFCFFFFFVETSSLIQDYTCACMYVPSGPLWERHINTCARRTT